MAYPLRPFVISFAMADATGKKAWLWRGGEGPRDIPQWAYQHLVTVLKVDPDFSGTLKCVEQLSYMGKALVRLIRIFAPEMNQQQENIKDFASLDHYPERILFEGYQEESSGRIVMFEGPRKSRFVIGTGGTL